MKKQIRKCHCGYCQNCLGVNPDTERAMKAAKKKKDKISEALLAYETGELAADKTLELFADLVRTGRAWKLQGQYGRMAQSLIDGGYLSKTGEILKPLGE